MKFLLILVILVSLGCKPVDELTGSDVKIIGGAATDQTVFSSFIAIPGCSGVVVNPTVILTAAHCVHNFSTDGTIRDAYRPGTSFMFHNNPQAGGTGVNVTVRSIHIHPTWERTCTAVRPCPADRAGAAHDPAVVDLAVITLHSPITVRPAVVDYTPVQVGESVTLGGYGCEGGIGTGMSGRRHMATTAVANPQVALAHPGSQRAQAIPQTLQSNFVTPGQMDGGASLCPGDSGGPVYRALSDLDRQRMARGEAIPTRVVGINADYTFTGSYEQQGAKAKTNIHTRLDASHIRSWLEPLVGPSTMQGTMHPSGIAIALVTEGSSLQQVNVRIAAASPVANMEVCLGQHTQGCPSGTLSGSFIPERQVVGRHVFKVNPANQNLVLQQGQIYTVFAKNQAGAVISKRSFRVER